VLGNLSSATSDFAVNGQLVPRAIRVAFINNTDFRAVFTFGAYDPLDKDTLPTGFSQLRLEPQTSSETFLQPCRRTFSVGGAELIRLIDENRNDPSVNITDERALVDGVNFSGAPLGDPLEADPTEGTAEGSDKQVGVDFACERKDIRDTTGTGLLIFTFESDGASPGGFRIDFQFLAS